ncbi:MAG: AAA family ATPase [Oscillospiraceae bacterium]
MKLDFLRSLCAQGRHAWPEVVLCRVEGEPLPVCCLSEAAAGDLFSRVGIVSAPSEALTALLRTAPVRARVTALCDAAGEPCDGDTPDVVGLSRRIPLRRRAQRVRCARRIDGAAARGCARAEALTARAEYLLEQAVPEAIILRVFAEMFSLPEYPEMVPDPPVRYVQADSFGALTRAWPTACRGCICGWSAAKGCGKNTLIQTVDWLLNVPQYRMQGNAELDKLDLLGGPTIENGTMRYRLSDMLRYLAAGADVVLDEGNTIKPECADVLHSLTDAARQIQVPGYGLVQMHPHSAFTITMNEDYAGTNFMNEATIDRFTPIHIAEPETIVDVLRRVVPEASGASLNICDYVYCAIRDRIRSAGGA